MDVPESEHILETVDHTSNHPSNIPPIKPEQLKSEYDNVLRLSRKLANAIDILSSTSDDSNSALRQFCLETGIPTAFTKERLLFKKSLLNKIEDQMFLPSSSNVKPGGPGTNILDVRNVGNIKDIEQVIEYGGIWKYLRIEEDEEEDNKSYLEARFVEEFKKLASPLQIISSKFFKQNTPIDLFISLVKSQFKIKWNTEDGQYDPSLNFFTTVDEKFQKHRLYNAWLQTKLFENRTKIEALNGDLSKFKDSSVIPRFLRKKVFQGKKARSKRKRNKTYEPDSFAWKNFDGGNHEIFEDFPINWLPPKLKTVVKKHTADHVRSGPIGGSDVDSDEDEGNGSIDGDANKNPNQNPPIVITGTEADPDNDEDLSDTEQDEEATSSGVYMLVLQNEDSPKKCQIYFNYFTNNLNRAMKRHERNISKIAVNLCKIENFNYDNSLRTIDILLLLNILLNKNIVCFEIARNLEEVGDAVAIVLDVTSKETTLQVKPEEIVLWGVPTSPGEGLNSKIELTDLRNRFTPSEFPGSDR